jgi:hypothetical protein
MLLVAGLLLAWPAEVRPGLAADGTSAQSADSPGGPKSAVQAASYSTGKSGSRLKWLPQRGKSAHGDSAVTAAQYAEPSADVPSRPSSAGVFGHSLGGKKKAGAATAETPDELLPEAMPSEPKPAGAPPGAAPAAPTAKRSPYYSPDDLLRSGAPRPNHGAANELLLERESKLGSTEFKESCPSAKALKHIDELGTNITPPEGDLPHDCPLAGDVFQPRCFAPITYAWTASGLCHKPLYFEDVQLERYGHMCGPWLQPFASGFQFFATIPILPYKMGLELPGECIYTLGYYRPGDCAPYMIDPIPLSVRAAFFESCAWVGGVYAIP